ncbi:MAG: outer membrane protein assembly factor BamA [Akkermansia sp.]|nr:outer membrane protein assembly factor BamA [Akkermansia sp.]
MNKPTLHWSAALTALALTIAAPAFGQESTGDAFLDAMMKDQQAEQETTSSAAAPAADPFMDAVSTKKKADPQPVASPAGPVETRLVSAASDTRLLDEAEVVRELGPATGLFQNDSAFDGKRVAGVEFRYTGNKVLPDRRLMDVVQTRAGGEYSSVRVNADLERLIERSLVDPDATVAVQPSGNAVKVIFNVRASSVLAGVGFTGNVEFDDDDLRETSKLQPGTVLSDASLAAARANIIKAYQEAGYPDTQVSWRAEKTASGSYKDVVFDIKENREVSMNTISFEGNKQFDDEQLRQIMQTKERGFFTWITKSGRIDREQVEDDLEAVVKLYRNYGYLRARLANVEYTASPNKEGRQKLHLKVTIDEGPRYRVRNVTFGKITAYTPAELEQGLSMLNGDIYSLQKVSDDVTMIRSYYGAKGYADAEVRPDINEVGVDAKGTRLIDIRYDVNEGSRYKVGRINVRGNTKTRQHVILRELPLKPGENLNSVDLETARKRLENLNYFDQVEVSQGLTTTSGYRDINVNVHEKMTGSLTLGVAFSTVENVYLYTTITQSNFDIRGFVNGGTFVGGGQRLTLNGKLGTEYSSASIYLLEPWFLDRKLALGQELYYSKSTYLSDYYQQNNYGYSVSLRKALSDLTSVKFEYKIEQYGIETESYAPIFFEEQDGDYTRSHFRLSYEYDSRDAMVTPRKGGHLEGHVGYSGPGSTVETYTVGLSGSYYYNSFWDSIFSVNFGLETVDTVSGGDDVPIFERCYLGGPANLRGFRYRDVGMIDEALAGDETMGGNSSAFVQFEVTLPVIESVRFAMFVDAGFVHKDSFDFKPTEWAADYGIGLRINLPMGPLAVDYAIPFKSENCADDDGQFQFYVDYKY